MPGKCHARIRRQTPGIRLAEHPQTSDQRSGGQTKRKRKKYWLEDGALTHLTSPAIDTKASGSVPE